MKEAPGTDRVAAKLQERLAISSAAMSTTCELEHSPATQQPHKKVLTGVWLGDRLIALSEQPGATWQSLMPCMRS